MKSPFANLFTAIQERISQEVPGIAHIAHDLGQLSVKTRPPVSWPCLLIDFEDFTFENLGENVQTAKGTVLLKLGFAPHSNTSQATPSEYKDSALGYYDLEWYLHKALHSWSPDGNEYGHLIRAATLTQRRADAYRVRELRYAVSFDDYSTKPTLQYVPAALIINSEIDI